MYRHQLHCGNAQVLQIGDHRSYARVCAARSLVQSGARVLGEVAYVKLVDDKVVRVASGSLTSRNRDGRCLCRQNSQGRLAVVGAGCSRRLAAEGGRKKHASCVRVEKNLAAVEAFAKARTEGAVDLKGVVFGSEDFRNRHNHVPDSRGLMRREIECEGL